MPIQNVANQGSVAFLQNFPMHQIAGTVVTKAGTITGTAGLGSSLFLNRMYVPAMKILSEVDVAMRIDFPATNQGAGTMSRTFAIYSIKNNTQLSLVSSMSQTFAWSTGTSTTAGAVSLTQFQGGWSANLMQPITFNSFTLGAGDYVIGNLFDFAQGSSTWTINLFGAMGASTALAAAATGLTSATLGALSSGGLVTGNVITAITSLTTNNAANTAWFLSSGSSAASSNKGTLSTSTTFIQLPLVNALGSVTGSIHTATGSLGAVTNVALAALGSTTLAQLTLPNFGYIGTGSTTSGLPNWFYAGIMSTGAMPAAITITSTAVTYTGSAALVQPWFALIGSAA